LVTPYTPTDFDDGDCDIIPDDGMKVSKFSKGGPQLGSRYKCDDVLDEDLCDFSRDDAVLGG